MRNKIDDTFEYYKDSGRYLMVDVALHRSQGVCVWSPELVLMARPVDSRDEPKRIIDPFVRYDVAVCDGWFVHWCAGDVALVGVLITLFPFVLYERGCNGDFRLRKVASCRL
ncbi:MAG: hypothetical protein RR808_09445 [Akkermansia sp.]